MVEDPGEGYVGKHTCPCCGYVCKNDYVKGTDLSRRVRRRTPATEKLIDQVEIMRQAGMKLHEIAEDLDMKKGTLYTRLRYGNYENLDGILMPHKNNKTEEFKESYAELKATGLSDEQVCKKMGMNQEYFMQRLLELGLRERKRRRNGSRK